MTLIDKIKRATGPKAELGGVLLDLMVEYFQLCSDANDEKAHAARQPFGSSARADRELAADVAVEKAERLEALIVQLAGPIEELLG